MTELGRDDSHGSVMVAGAEIPPSSALNEHLRKFHYHRKCLYYAPLLVESSHYHFHILRHYAKQLRNMISRHEMRKLTQIKRDGGFGY